MTNNVEARIAAWRETPNGSAFPDGIQSAARHGVADFEDTSCAGVPHQTTVVLPATLTEGMV